MATGDTLQKFFPGDHMPPASGALATFDTRNGHNVLDFDAGQTEEAVFEDILASHYAGGGFNVKIHYSMSSATSGGVRFDIAIERVGDEQQDVDSDSFAAVQSVTDTVPGTSGNVGVATVTLTDGSQIDSVAVGEKYRLKIQRDHDHAGDTATGDMELHGIELRET